jgi:NADH dehydrogenase
MLYPSKRPRVVIVGAGFAGLYAAKALRRDPVEVLVIDQNNYHTFQPLIYQVATAGLEPGDVAHNVRAIFHRQKNFAFRQATVTGVDWEAKMLELAGGARERFDYLILAAGAVYNDFGIPGVKEHAFFLKSLTEAVNIRSHILRQLERASANPDLVDQGALNIVIVGGGPTGVEMAGALTELFDRVLPQDYPELDLAKAKIILIEAMAFLLPPYSEASRTYAETVLRERGVVLRLGSTLTAVHPHGVELQSGEVIPTQTLIWAAGVRGHPLVDALGLELERGHRIKVNPDLSLPGRPFAFAAGDLAGSKDASGKLHPQVAPVAIQHGKHIAKTIRRQLREEPTRAFAYFDKGSMAIIGRNAGVAELSPTLLGLRFRGLLGWLAWLFIHLIYLPGYQNRFSALFNWVYNYLTFDRHSRLITNMCPALDEVTETSHQVVPEQQVSKPPPRIAKRETEAAASSRRRASHPT